MIKRILIKMGEGVKMYYCYDEEGLVELEESADEAEALIGVFHSEEWMQNEELKEAYGLPLEIAQIRFCKLEMYSEYLYGTFHIPIQKKYNEYISFTCYITKNKVFFIDDQNYVEKNILQKNFSKSKSSPTIGRFMNEFLEVLVKDDLLYLQNIEECVAKLEEEAAFGRPKDDFAHRLIHLKKELLRFYRYYRQLIDFAERLRDSDDNFTEKEINSFHILAERIERIASETEVIREYAMQVQDVYHSLMDRKQNDVMKMLTIVTTIFLPLTLIAGWYGMNFQNMPELSYQYGYPLTAIASILIVIVSCVVFKVKKYW